MNDLEHLFLTAEKAERALIDALSVREVQAVYFQAIAMEALAKAAKNPEKMGEAIEIKMWSERRLGEMMAASPKAKAGRIPARNRVGEKPELALAEAGIDKNLADRARKALALDRPTFEATVAEARKKGIRATLKVISLNRTEQRRAEVRERIKRIQPRTVVVTKAIATIEEEDLASGSVAAVITDPPYGEDTLSVYRDLGVFAMRVLRPGGWCLVMPSSIFLDRVMEDLLKAGLAYRWVISARFPGGPSWKIIPLRLYQGWKPVLVFQKPPAQSPPGEAWYRDEIDVVKAAHDKSLHAWQQPEALFATLIERFTEPGDLVADPFAGSGTTLVAAESMGRHAWGGDDGSADHLQAAE
jgi:16S rRNA G966 N2-methylase RsmD